MSQTVDEAKYFPVAEKYCTIFRKSTEENTTLHTKPSRQRADDVFAQELSLQNARQVFVLNRLSQSEAGRKLYGLSTNDAQRLPRYLKKIGVSFAEIKTMKAK